MEDAGRPGPGRAGEPLPAPRPAAGHRLGRFATPAAALALIAVLVAWRASAADSQQHRREARSASADLRREKADRLREAAQLAQTRGTWQPPGFLSGDAGEPAPLPGWVHVRRYARHDLDGWGAHDDAYWEIAVSDAGHVCVDVAPEGAQPTELTPQDALWFASDGMQRVAADGSTTVIPTPLVTLHVAWEVVTPPGAGRWIRVSTRLVQRNPDGGFAGCSGPDERWLRPVHDEFLPSVVLAGVDLPREGAHHAGFDRVPAGDTVVLGRLVQQWRESDRAEPASAPLGTVRLRFAPHGR